ncbi:MULTISPECIES: hypothetical protein [Moorena]|uniref:Uncharacterized protein n=1 Tax=Moorena producens (strain JHB) TaxID=1454205 RepID=A0A1D9G104_MOOP1|nr:MULTISPECIES: hypothetical protein [Moorena]AOY81298.1 hypothetical protein BJP36_16705 [Moorena producens JHB]NEQ16872.1 hypothetical protein [Moorena sp. SIO3E2]NER86581.1 hypothetical protein [Moorena sp. SIO3A2]NET63110.1 hypothetical protein [Moorena sp. SIO1G6]
MSKNFKQNLKKQPVEHTLKGPRQAVIHSMQRFYSLGYGEIADWSPLEPTETPGEVMTTMMKYWLLP